MLKTTKMLKTIKAIVVGGLLMTGLLLAGCGQKGPLFLPDTSGAPEQASTQKNAD